MTRPGSDTPPRATERDRADEEIRDLLRRSHVSEAPAPTFQALWRRAEGQLEERSRAGARPSRALRFAGLSSLLAAAAAVILLAVLRDSPTPATLDEAEALHIARSIGRWQGPLEFLHEVPGRDLLQISPILFSAPVLPDSADARLGTTHPSSKNDKETC